jgi:hypothetical protein
VYRECCDLLHAELIFTEPYQRPVEKAQLSAMDQASQRPVFGAATDRGSPEEFLSCARSRPHPSAGPRPSLPGELDAAVLFVWECGSGIIAERERRLRVLRTCAARLEPLSALIACSMSDDARRVARAMALNVLRRTSPAATLADADAQGGSYAPHFALWCALGDALGDAWPFHDLVRCMLCGFRTVGDIPDTGLFRPVVRPADMSLAAFAASHARWVYECRARVLSRARAEPEMARACWAKTADEIAAGLVYGPFTLAQLNTQRSSGFPACGFGRHRPLPRFGIIQSGKCRCIDDGAASGTNRSGVSTCETIHCDRPDSPLRIGLRFHELGPPPCEPSVSVLMGGGTDDYFAFYRRVVTADGEYTVVMVAMPREDGGFDAVLLRVPGHNFGLTSAVLNAYCIPAFTCTVSRRLLATPVTHFYDDHQVSEPSYTGGSGQRAHFELHEVLRFHFDLQKHVVWQRSVVYTGVLTDWSADHLGFVSVGVTSERRDKVAERISAILRSGSLTPAEASSLRGKARFCVCPVFGRVGLAAVAALRGRQVSSGETVVDPELADALELLRVVVLSLPSFCLPIHRGVRHSVVVLTDASFASDHTWLGFLVAHPINGVVWAGMATPAWLLAWLASIRVRGTYIGQLEAIAVAAVYFSLPALASCLVSHYVDNQGALYGFIRGSSADAAMNRIIFVGLLQIARMSCDVWFDYVPSASNAADLPTRLDAAAFLRLARLGSRVRMVLPPESVLSCPLSELGVLVRSLAV